MPGPNIRITHQRQMVFAALMTMPEPVWLAYLTILRSVNMVFRNTVIEDPTPCDALENAIARELGL